ncbi:MAG TPA: hypothetical protein P5137_16175, partial [Candidatus Brocadiia bacterium]|nr:hypothetical protein [Candidatus Brocadiia bacterium]
MGEVVISDLAARARPAEAVSSTPRPGCWLSLPYEAEGFAGTMILGPTLESQAPEVSIPLPNLGVCEIRVGIYGSGEAPVWLHCAFGRQRGAKPWNRVCLRLSSEDYLDWLTPDAFGGGAGYDYISESLWKTADVNGQSLVLSPPRQEALRGFRTCVAYVRLVPVARAEAWPANAKRLVNYFDANFMGHFVRDAAEVRSRILPLRESDAAIALWCSSREDTCLYPTRVGNTLAYHGVPDVYPHWIGRDLQLMLSRGEDPLAVACGAAHAAGLRLFSSYRRLTCRLPPHTFPLHPDAMLVKRKDLWAVGADGRPAPHLSLAFPEVRQRVIAILSEQASNYDIDGVHLFFSRGVPFMLFEKPFLDRFAERHGGLDPRYLAPDDARVVETRGDIFVGFMRELRRGMDEAGKARGRRVEVALTVMNSLENSAWYGMDVARLAEERLVDMLLPFPCHYRPDGALTPERVAAFAAVAKPRGIGLYPDCGYDYSMGKEPLEVRAARMYAAGADGLQVMQNGVRGEGSAIEGAVARRLGRVAELGQADSWRAHAARPVRVRAVAGMSLEQGVGLETCG